MLQLYEELADGFEATASRKRRIPYKARCSTLKTEYEFYLSSPL